MQQLTKRIQRIQLSSSFYYRVGESTNVSIDNPQLPSSLLTNKFIKPQKINVDQSTTLSITSNTSLNRSCFYLKEDDALFIGTLFETPGKELPSYMAFLKTLENFSPALLFPSRGDVIINGVYHITKRIDEEIRLKEKLLEIISSHKSASINDLLRRNAIAASPSWLLEHLEILEKENKVEKHSDSNLSIEPTTLKGPGGITLDKVFKLVQESKRKDSTEFDTKWKIK